MSSVCVLWIQMHTCTRKAIRIYLYMRAYCIYVCIHSMYKCMCMCMCTFAYVCVCVRVVCVCVCVCLHTCMHTCVVCLFVCVSICVTTYTHAHTKHIHIRDREGARESKKDSRGSLLAGAARGYPFCMYAYMPVCVEVCMYV